MTNEEIIERCLEFRRCTEQEQWHVDGESLRKIGDALFHVSGLVLPDMKYLARMGCAGLGYGAGPQVRRLLEASTVVYAMQQNCDVGIADAIHEANATQGSLSGKLISKARRRLTARWERGYKKRGTRGIGKVTSTSKYARNPNQGMSWCGVASQWAIWCSTPLPCSGRRICRQNIGQ